MRKPLRVEDLLRTWGEAQLLNGPGSPLRPDGGENDHTLGAADDMASQCAYVEDTPGFGRAKAALTWVYVHNRPENGCGDLDALWDFRWNLREKIKTKPWIPPLPHDALCSYDQAIMAAAQATAEAETKYKMGHGERV